MVKGKSKKTAKRFGRTPRGPTRKKAYKQNASKEAVSSQAKGVSIPADWIRISPTAKHILQGVKTSGEFVCITKENINSYSFDGVGKVGVWAPKDIVALHRPHKITSGIQANNSKTLPNPQYNSPARHPPCDKEADSRTIVGRGSAVEATGDGRSDQNTTS